MSGQHRTLGLARRAAALSAGAVLLFRTSEASADAPCRYEPSAADVQGSANDVTERARGLAESKSWVKAAALYRTVALRVEPNGIAAAQSSLRALGKALDQTTDASERSACTDAIAADAQAYAKLYCSPGSTPSDECRSIERIDSDVRRSRADALLIAAAKESPFAARLDFLKAGDDYVAVWRARGTEDCKKASNECTRSGDALLNAITAFRAGKDLSKAWAVRSMLLDPANHLSETPVAQKSRFDGAYEAMAIAEYGRAATGLEDAVRASPKSDQAPQALDDAVLLRVGLGDLPRAKDDALDFEKLFGRTAPEKVARIDFVVGVTLADEGEWKEVDDFVSSRAALVEKVEPLLSIELDVVDGRALAHLGRKKDADTRFHHVADMSQSSLQAAADKAGGEQDAHNRAFGRALTAFGEAKLELADETRDQAMALTIKKGDRASVTKKRDAIDRAEKEYGAISSIAPFPPPKATVAAAARIAKMRSTLWAQAFLALGDAGAASDEQAALAANRACVALSVKLQWIDDGAKSCEAWLEKHDAVAPRAVTEIVPALRGSNGMAAPIFVDKAGDPWSPP